MIHCTVDALALYSLVSWKKDALLFLPSFHFCLCTHNAMSKAMSNPMHHLFITPLILIPTSIQSPHSTSHHSHRLFHSYSSSYSSYLLHHTARSRLGRTTHSLRIDNQIWTGGTTAALIIISKWSCKWSDANAVGSGGE